MNYFLLFLHIASAIVFIGGVTVSASLFPRYATAEAAAPYAASGGHPAALAMHRITKGYGRLALITPLAGLALAFSLGVVGQLWIILSIVLVAIGGALLIWRVIPIQKEMLRNPPTDPRVRGRAMASAGLLNTVWFAILILMVIKPGGTG